MIRLFKNIRKALLSEKRLSKYFFYAIGELSLVVIGILVALQVNNWNEDRKNRTLELKTLRELRSDLVQARTDIDGNIDALMAGKHANKVVLDHILNKYSYHDSLDGYFANLYPYITFSPVQTTYNNLTQSGVKLISNDSLRTSITNLYSNLFPTYKTFESTYLVEHYENYIKPMLMKEFSTFELFVSFKPRNYQSFINNEYYPQILNYTIENYQMFILLQTSYLDSIDQLIKQIDQEIDL